MKKAVLCVILAGLMLSCEQIVGLGSKADLAPPILGTGENGIKPASGAYISARTVLTGHAKDDIGVSKVEVSIIGYKRGAGELSTDTYVANYNQATGNFSYDFASQDYDDGEIKVIYTIFDKQGKTTEAPEIPYIVKNLPPQIRMTVPAIQDAEFDDANLNIALADEANWIPYINDLMGMATDAYGIARGYPQIMLWPKDNTPVENDGKFGEWRKMKMPKDADGLLATQFTWPLKKLVQSNGAWVPSPGSNDSDYLEPGEYRFKIRTMDKNGVVNTYPNRLDNKAGPNGSALDPSDPSLNQYMQIRIIAITNPRITILNTPEKPFPAYYKGTEDFVAHITVTAANPIVSVRGKLGNSDFSSTSAGNIYSAISQGGNEYTLVIPRTDNGLDFADLSQELFLEAQDNAGKTAAAGKAFQIDKNAPKVEINEPAAYDARVTSTTSLRGSAEDAETQVMALYYALGWKESGIVDPNSPSVAPDETGWHDTGLAKGKIPASGNIPINNAWKGTISNWTWTFDNIGDITRKVKPVAPPSIGDAVGDYVKVFDAYGDDPSKPSYLYELPIKFKAVDTAGNIGIKEFRVIVDPDADAPFVEITSHHTNDIVGGEVRLSGTANDNDWIYGVEIRIRKMPDAKTQTSFDNVDTNSISRSGWLWATGTGTATGNGEQNWIPVTTGTKSSVVSWFHSINKAAPGEADYLTPPEGKQRLVDIEVRARDATLNNQNLPKSTGPITRITLKFDGTVPTIKDIKILRANMPDLDYDMGVKVSGAFKIQAKIRDESGISSIKIKGDETNTYDEVINNSTYISGPEKDANGMVVYTLTVPINSNSAWFNGIFENKSGSYNLGVQIQDTNSPMPNLTQATITLQIDNYYPLGSYTGKTDAAGTYSISGKARDTGTGISVQGVDRVVVYFSRDGNPISLWQDHPESALHPAQWIYNQKAKPGRSAESETPGSEITLSFFPKNSAISNNAGIVINDNGDIPGVGGNNYNQSFTGNPDKEWSAKFDTGARFKDGPVTLHYVIFDTAGNASYFEKKLVIKNNIPSIASITLGTDLIGHPYNNEVFDGNKKISANYENTGFTSRNNALRFRIESSGGNGAIHYKVSSILGESAPKAVQDLEKGKAYKIETAGAGTIWKDLGLSDSADGKAGDIFIASVNGSAAAGSGTVREIRLSEAAQQFKSGAVPAGTNTIDLVFRGNAAGQNFAASGGIPDANGIRFFVKAYDTMIPGGDEKDQLSDCKIISLNINNIDETLPKARLYDLNPNAEASIKGAGGTVNDWSPVEPTNSSIKRLGENESRGSIYREGTTASPLIQGHIEPRGVNPNQSIWVTNGVPSQFPRDQVSGKVILRGYTEDNQRITGIKLQFGNDENTAFDILKADSTTGRLVPVTGAGSANIKDGDVKVYDELDLDGHRVEWAFIWDSTQRPAGVIVGEQIAVKAIVLDANSNKSAEAKQEIGNADYNSIKVDLVPYIAEVETALSPFYKRAPSVFNRTAQGHYPVAEKDIIKVHVFNAFDTAKNDITLDGKILDITGNTSDTGRPSRTLSANIKTGSTGGLVVTANSIKSKNNTNNNEAVYNQQPNGINNDTLTDDAVIDVWQFTEVFKSRSESRYPTMKVGPQGQIGFSFANDYQWFNMPGYLYKADSSAATNAGNNNGFWSQTPYQRAWGGFTYNTFAFDPKGFTYGAAINIDEAGEKQGANFSFMNRRPNALPGDMGDHDNYEGALINAMRLENTALPSSPAKTSWIVDVNRIQSPAIVTSMRDPKSAINDTDNRVNVYMAYYDRTTKQVRFRSGSVGKNRSDTMGSDILATVSSNNLFTTNEPHNLAAGTEVYIHKRHDGNPDKTIPYYVLSNGANSFSLSSTSGGSIATVPSGDYGVSVSSGGLVDLSGNSASGYARIDYADAKPSSYQTVAASGQYNPGKSITYNNISGATGWTTDYPQATEYGPGKHVAIEVVKNGNADVALLAWFDEQHDQLVYSYNINPSGNSAAQWQSNAKTIEDNAGEGVSMAVDSNGGVHLAYYSSNGADLKYAYAPSYHSDFSIVTVDSYLSVGTLSTITVGMDASGRQVPYISYYATGAAALRAKVAYRDYATVPNGGTAVAGSDSTDRVTGAWEISVVPTKNTPSEYKVSVGVYTVNGYLVEIPSNTGGTLLTGSGYAGTIPVDAPTRVYGNGTLNPVVGYGTASNLEMAQKK
ncbi:Ig-like domain-containing protein [Leadbettera azotonutricia]|nr:Ig-like domain-containing protein [Leadbettera azotonutricia]